MISFKLDLHRKKKSDKDQLRFLDCVFNYDVPPRSTDKAEAIITIKPEDEESFIKWCYEHKILASKMENHENEKPNPN